MSIKVDEATVAANESRCRNGLIGPEARMPQASIDWTDSFCQVSYAQERLNKNGDIWLKMTFTDLTGQIEVRCGEEPLLELAGLGPGDGAELQRQQMRFVILERASLYIEGRVAPDRNDANTMHLSLVRRAAQIVAFPTLGNNVLSASPGLYPCKLS